MQIGATSASSVYQLWGGQSLRVNVRGGIATEPKPEAADVQAQLRSLRTSLLRLQDALTASTTALTTARGLTSTITSPARVTSSSRLDLGSTSTFSTVTSTPEIVGRFGAIIPETAVFGSTSTAYPTIGGSYYGTTDETFTFTATKVTGGGQIGVDDIDITVTDSAGNVTDVIKMSTEAPGTEFELSSGLTVSFEDGTIKHNEVFRIDATAGPSGAPTTTDPVFEGGSTSSPTVGGNYTGTDDDVLTFTAVQVSRQGEVGRDQVTFSVNNSAGVEVDSFRLRREAPGTVFTLSSGLEVSFSEGNIDEFDSFTVDVTGQTPGTISTTTPQFEGASSSATLGGEYGGDDDVLTFTIVSAAGRGVVGKDEIVIEVTNSAGEVTDTITSKHEPAGTEFQLGSGLTIALGEGSVAEGGFFSLPVSAPGDGTINADNPFDGTGADDPAFADGVEVVAGSFTVNGVQIDVAADDSVNSVLAKINASGAGVTGTFDAATQTVTLEATTAGPVDIEFGADSSGFLDAVNLTDAPVALGSTSSDADVALADLEAFSSVTAGEITINGVAIAIDPTTDSLNDIIERINGAGAGVRAALSGERFELLGSTSSDLVVDSGTTGFFGAVGVLDGVYSPKESKTYGGSVLPANARAVAEELTKVATALEDVISRTASSSTFNDRVRDTLETLVHRFNHYQSPRPEIRTRFGLRINLGTDAGASLDKSTFASEVVRDTAAVDEALFGSARRADDGLFERLSATVEDLVAELDAELGSTGRVVDVLA